MKRTIILLTAAMLTYAGTAFAIPTFQTYGVGAVAGSYGPDQDTWYVGNNPFTLRVAGAYGPNTQSLTDVTLLISVLQGQTGTISITGPGGALPLMTVKDTSAPINPNTAADTNILTDRDGLDGYATTNFLPPDANFNNHYPLQNSVSDFLLFNIGSLLGTGTVQNYNADNGTISGSQAGQEINYIVSFTGFTMLHFDVYGLETDLQGNSKISSSWDINPGSHDSTANPNNPVPEPGTFVLVGAGLLGLAIYGKRRMKD